MNTALKMKLEEMNRRLNEALDTDLFEESESEFNEFQAEVDSFASINIGMLMAAYANNVN